MKVIITGSVLLLLVSSGWAEWYRSLVGTAPNVLNQLCLGDGRNDGVQRVYAVCEDAHVYEWTFSGGNWTQVDMGQVSGSGWCLGICLGNGKNDGLNRIYITRINGHVYEYFYSGGSWTITDLGNPGYYFFGVKIGQARNDGTNRVYVCGYGTPTVEYTWTGTDWQKDTVQGGDLQQWLLDIGHGRNDGINRIYAPNGEGAQKTVTEYTWNGSSYDWADLPLCPGNPLSVDIGPGRNDGVNRVYVSTRSKAHEFTYQAGNWQMVDILPSFGNESRYNICLGTTKSDGQLRAYITCSGTQLLESTWDGNVWVDSVVDAVSSATCGVFVGRGRNDDTVRVYGCNRSGNVYEFTHSDPYVGIEQQHLPVAFASGLNLEQNYPNPFEQITEIRYQIAEGVDSRQKSVVSMNIYDITGRFVRTLVNEPQEPGHYMITWNGCSKHGKKMPVGIYLYRLQIGELFEQKKMLILR